MGSCLQKPKSEEDIQSRRIDKKLELVQKESDDHVNLLLLGAGESGKSTIFKQMKLLHLNGFDESEKKDFKQHIHSNAIESIQVLIKGMKTLNFEFTNERNIELSEKINDIKYSQELTQEIAQSIKSIWEDQSIRQTFQVSNQFQLIDSAEYFLSQIETISQPNYIPTIDDILNVRVRTTGISETEFDYEDIHFKMTDVGGQRSERKKWIHCFSDITAVFFIGAISEYDQTLFEETDTKRMTETLMLFDEICNSRWFRDSSIILFLNKIDIFEKKIKHIDLNVCFEDYDGGCDYETARNYIKEKFLELNQQTDRLIYPYFTCATDSENISSIFKAVKDTIFQSDLQDLGLL
ncbi:guanine nucleotide-binding protein g(o) subunit alpha [Anaeramoeba flamelloides]|uniref:Guanine nucleotide-binding protein g(O) subunit alpha n=1 Tax=Anaeramoeba flamelloides TaxID=1746091 RepID=A0AAV7YTP7_9EUKA|nr:guanine nucleotide-binding protein g(o) subunit alpha [Anaeramoeba flamelloides]